MKQESADSGQLVCLQRQSPYRIGLAVFNGFVEKDAVSVRISRVARLQETVHRPDAAVSRQVLVCTCINHLQLITVFELPGGFGGRM